MPNITRLIPPSLVALLVLGAIAALTWAESREQNGQASQQHTMPAPAQSPLPQPSPSGGEGAAQSQVETATFALG